jgi:hypothetical protein
MAAIPSTSFDMARPFAARPFHRWRRELDGMRMNAV